MTNATSNNHIVQNYKKKIPDHLKSLYQDIVEERKKIYYTGYVLGLAIAILFILFNIKVLNKSFSTISMVCITTTIAFVVNYFYYILSPKKAYMLDHLETPEQTQAWLQMYKTMQYHYHMGLVIGMIAVAVFSYGWCRK